MIYVGIDVAKQKHQIAILNDGGEIYRDNSVIQNNYLGFQKLHEILSHIQTETAQECQVALEDTGHYSLPLLQFLRKNRYLTYCYNPILIKEFSKVHTLRKTKTDKIDALMIAKKLMVDWEKRKKTKLNFYGAERINPAQAKTCKTSIFSENPIYTDIRKRLSQVGDIWASETFRLYDKHIKKISKSKENSRSSFKDTFFPFRYK